MNWRRRARVYNAIALLPSPLSYRVHRWLQTCCGGQKNRTAIAKLRSAARICRKILDCGKVPTDKVFLEIGTGRTITLPIALWLLGSREVFTVDLHPYLRAALVKEDFRCIQENQNAVKGLFKGLTFSEERFERLLDIAKNSWNLHDILALCNIEYIAPGDAAALPIPNSAVDYHISNLVLEEIHPTTLGSILREGNRVLKDDGLFVHHVDLSDEFAHTDETISLVNFLQFSDNEWGRITANMYMRMNRLRIDDYEKLFREGNQRVLSIKSKIDKSALKLLRDGLLKVNARFKDKSPEVLATVDSWIVSEKIS